MGSGILTVQYPSEVTDDDGGFSRQKLLTHYNESKEAAAKFVSKLGIEFSKHQLLVLVDLQGVYLGLSKWLAGRNFPQESGLVMSRLAFYMLENVASTIEEKIVNELEFGMTFTEVVKTIFRKEQITRPIRHVVDVTTNIELFYAPSPLAKIRNWLETKDSDEALRQLADVRKGVVKVHGENATIRIMTNL